MATQKQSKLKKAKANLKRQLAGRIKRFGRRDSFAEEISKDLSHIKKRSLGLKRKATHLKYL